jgi:hypothetical protein
LNSKCAYENGVKNPIWESTHRFEIGNTLACDGTFLRAQKAFLLEHERGTDEQAGYDGENDADDLCNPHITRATTEENKEQKKKERE